MAHLSYRWIERPTRSNRWLASQSNLQVIGVGIAAMGATGLLVAGMIGFRPAISRSVTRDAGMWTPTYFPTGQCPAVRTKVGMVDGRIRYDFRQDDFRQVTCPVDRDKCLFVIGNPYTWAYQRLFGHAAQRYREYMEMVMATPEPIIRFRLP